MENVELILPVQCALLEFVVTSLLNKFNEAVFGVALMISAKFVCKRTNQDIGQLHHFYLVGPNNLDISNGIARERVLAMLQDCLQFSDFCL